jgi:hypothetical protein
LNDSSDLNVGVTTQAEGLGPQEPQVLPYALAVKEGSLDETTVENLDLAAKEDAGSVRADVEVATTENPEVRELEPKLQIFDETTIAFPDQRPAVEAAVVEDEDFEAEKIFDVTTIAFPIGDDLKTSPAASADLDNSEPKKDENGLLIETTTGGGPSNRVEAVHEAVRKSGRHPAKQSAEDDSAKVRSGDDASADIKTAAFVNDQPAAREDTLQEQVTVGGCARNYIPMYTCNPNFLCGTKMSTKLSKARDRSLYNLCNLAVVHNLH